jgi:hypothetical protein
MLFSAEICDRVAFEADDHTMSYGGAWQQR